MEEIKSYTDLEQSKKLAEILPLETADMCWTKYVDTGDITRLHVAVNYGIVIADYPCWSLAALLNVLLEINGIPLTLEKVKAEDGYEGYYYHIEYKDIVLIPYSKNPIDACYNMIIRLHELNLL